MFFAPCTGDLTQLWSYESDATIHLTWQDASYGTGMCIDIPNYSNTTGTGLWLYQCHTYDHTPGHENQEWTLNSDGTITSNLNGLCLDLAVAFNATGSDIVINSCDQSSTQKFTWSNGTSNSTVVNVYSGLCLTSMPPGNCSIAPYNAFPYCNPDLYVTERVQDLISRMYVGEKISMLDNSNGGVPRLGVPPLPFAECLHGVLSGCGQAVDGSTGCPTSFPSGLGIGAGFNVTMPNSMAQIISTEARSLHNQGVTGLSFWAPDINLFRDPRWGRGQEVPGEDPVRSSRYVEEYSKGLQIGEDPRYYKVISTCKHFSGYDLENWGGFDRYDFNAIIDQQDLVQYYWPTFEACVRDAHVGSIMCSYNSVNGVPSCANDLFNNDIVRGEWGFDGFIVSDCGAIDCIINNHHYTNNNTETCQVAMRGGCDLECGSFYSENLAATLQIGALNETDLDLALTRVFTRYFMLGMLDPDVPYRNIPPAAVDTPYARDMALLAAQEAITLLQNNGSILPLDPSKSVAFIGPHANATQAMLSNYFGTNTLVNSHSPYQVAVRRGLDVSYSYGCDIDSTDTSGFETAVSAASAADYAVVFLGLDQTQECEGLDRTFITLPGVQNLLAQAVLAANPNTVVVLINGGQVAIEQIKASVKGIVEAFYPGELGGDAINDVLFGNYNPGGKLPYTFYPADFILRNMTNMDLQSDGGITYMWYQGVPLWPYGWGLSYTTFTYSWISSPSGSFSAGSIASKMQQLEYEVNVTNTGNVAGDAVVLAFVSGTPPDFPLSSLFDFMRVTLQPGQSKILYFTNTVRSLSTVDKEGQRWLNPGQYTVSIGDVVAPAVAKFALEGDTLSLPTWVR